MEANEQLDQRVWRLPIKENGCLDLLKYSPVDTIMLWLLGNAFKIHFMGANVARPAKSGAYMNRD
ncbi:phytanoyl-CoA dioxygenase [Colletotrichum gloeosporioides Cg-14]|uniref:Phytanoyl-CoA dioxygenase n=1 Tax=Colletotrichum gloeosporioides (strain Cg-14) TaxID=1237896 RepID=T0LBT5_COLGC|nr:phytanoyl-CoA dioxygenase [Colletotrichum gloeosporioides Cg-14]